MINVEALAIFRKKAHGCLSPTGELISCEVFEHFETMGVREYYDETYTKYWDDAHDQVAEEREEYGEDMHPEWHRFEMHDDSTKIAYRKAYTLGWVRLSADIQGKTLYAESIEPTLKKHKKELQFIADCIHLELDIRTQV